MNLAEEKESLKARDYEGVPLDFCQAVYDTIMKEKYKKIAVLSEDINLIDWVKLSQPDLMIHVMPGTRVDMAIVGFEFQSQALEVTKRIRKGGQVSFYGLNVAPLRIHFNLPANYDHWMTIEVPIGDGVFVARRI